MAVERPGSQRIACPGRVRGSLPPSNKRGPKCDTTVDLVNPFTHNMPLDRFAVEQQTQAGPAATAF
jgi:hypothetical protein